MEIGPFKVPVLIDEDRAAEESNLVVASAYAP